PYCATLDIVGFETVHSFAGAPGESKRYRDVAEIHHRSVVIVKATGKYTGRARRRDYAAIRAWRA
ncbi:hypothetical protein PQR70_40320, partial [Paraburkholderia madseniana]